MSSPPPRSCLFVPSDNPARLTKAWGLDADVVIADLEDAVAPERKAAARAALADHLESAGSPRAELWIRINGLDTAEAAADLELVAHWPAVAAVVVPKARAAVLSELQLNQPIVALVETAAGVLEAQELAGLPQVAQLMLGTLDLAADLGVEVSPHADVARYARVQLALVSAASGLPGPIDGVWADISDPDGMRAEAEVARAAGFTGKACIHPSQIAIAQELFTPSPEAVAHARRVVAAADAAALNGDGVISLDGRMVDRPVVERSRRLIAAATSRVNPLTKDKSDGH
jgi:citrate lyase subunit beta/citryl-CoA lyase